ncbi:MAG: DUF1579 domain-containing protein [Planctomycetota bacterium]|nr:DUF1579 domain-containing protein [Planctomycetota bacterium]
MRRAMFPGVLILALAVGWFGHAAIAEEEPKDDADSMEAMSAVHKPGPNQALLARLAGDWDVKVKMFGADGKVRESNASATNKMLFGGRYLMMNYRGDFGGMPFDGIGIMAHDNRKKAFQNMWIDSGSSGIYMAEGSISKDGTVVTFRGEWQGHAGPIKSKDVLHFKGKDLYVFEGFMETPDGPVQNVELTYVRRAASGAK